MCLTCQDAANKIGFDFSIWPPLVVPVDKLLAHETFDDEGASLCFSGKSWQGVFVKLVLEHPTALSFLSLEAFKSYSPAVLVACLWSFRNDEPKELITQWGIPIESAKNQALVVLDHFFSRFVETQDQQNVDFSKSQLGIIHSIAVETGNPWIGEK